MIRIPLPAWLAVLAICQVGSAQDGYRIRIRDEDKVGDRHHIVSVEKTTQKILVTGADGNALNKKDEEEQKSQTFVETILAKVPGKRANKLTRKFEKVSLEEQGKKVDLPLTGKTVTVERKDGKYAFKLDEGELTDAMLKFLNDSFKHESDKEENLNDIFFSKEPVKVGQSWKCDPKAIVTELVSTMADSIDLSSATATGKLNNVYQKDGHPFGKIDIDMNVPIKSVGKGANKLDAKAGSYFKMKLHFDACIDGTQSAGKLNGTMEIVMLADVPLPNKQTGSLKVQVTSTLEETRKDLK